MQRLDLAKTVPATERRPTTCPLPGDEDGARSQLGSGDNMAPTDVGLEYRSLHDGHIAQSCDEYYVVPDSRSSDDVEDRDYDVSSRQTRLKSVVVRKQQDRQSGFADQ